MNRTQLERASNRIYAIAKEATISFSKAHPSVYPVEDMTAVIVAALVADGYTVPAGFKLHYGLSGVVKPATEQMISNKKLFEDYQKKVLAAQEAAIDSLYFTGTDVAAVLEALTESLKYE